MQFPNLSIAKVLEQQHINAPYLRANCVSVLCYIKYFEYTLLEKFRDVPGNFRTANVPNFYQQYSVNLSVTFLKSSEILLVKSRNFPQNKKEKKKKTEAFLKNSGNKKKPAIACESPTCYFPYRGQNATRCTLRLVLSLAKR